MKLFVALIAAALLSGSVGCSHKAKVRPLLQSEPLQARQAQVVKHFATAKTEHRKAVASLQLAKTSSETETTQISAITTRLESPSFQNSPVELNELKVEVASLQLQHNVTVKAIHDVSTEHGNVTLSLDRGEVAAQQINEQYGPAFVAAANAQTKELNQLDKDYAADSKALLWYRLHWWGSWIVLGLGVLGSVFFYILKIAAKTQ